MMKYLVIALILGTASVSAETDRVEDLLSRMTLDEKLGQLRQVGGHDEEGFVAAKDMSKEQSDEHFYRMIEQGEYGSLIGCRGVKGYNDAQRAAMKGRLGIPLLIGHDMIHGAITDYPIPIGISASWDTNLWFRCAKAVGPETWLKGANWSFAPMLDISRDARWGRIAESPGQDPYLAELYGYWWTLGLQGEKMSRDYRVAACAKHYVGYGAAEGGRDYNAVEMSESTLRNIYLPSFRGAIRAGLATVMPAFHTWNDVPCSINRYLLTDVLRDELGFKGFTISDWEAVWEVRKGRHGCAANDVEIAAKAINAGMDMEMLGGAYRRGLKTAVADGRVSMSVIDEAVRRILRVKFELGLFDRPFIDEEDVRRHIDFAANRRLAREAAQKSTVLLKNTKDILPLKKGLKIALVGSLGRSAKEMRGCWAYNEGEDGENMENATLEDGLKANGFEVVGADCYSPDFKNRLDVERLKSSIGEGDVVVACFGENLLMNGENRSRAYITLPGEQSKAVEIIKASGKPFIAVLFNGRPLAIPELAEACDALVEAWNPGSAGGWGVADVMCGAAEPTGRLTVDFPKTTGECPKYYNRLRTGRAQQDETDTRHPKEVEWLTHYLDTTQDSTFVFGEGLAYTTFAYANEKVEENAGSFIFTADITNTGKRIGTETVQLYTRDPVARISRPRRELKRFEKVTLAPGETKSVRFVLGADDLGYWCGREWVVEDGEFYAWIAPNSNAGKVLRFTMGAASVPRLKLIPQPMEVTRLAGCWRGLRQIVREIDPSLPSEGYVLEVSTNGIKIVSSDLAGAFYAEKTLAQLVEDDGSYPCVRITDAPSYRWRGYLLDCSRHFMDVATIKQVLDWMADYKFNVFHWHLVDDQGWRFPTKKYPRLRTVGAARPIPDWIGLGIYDDPGSDTYGPFGYSEDDIREIRAYAAARHIKIVPEMEIPGHSREVVVAYPEFYCENADARAYADMNNIGLCLGKDETIRFFKDCLDEFCELFPDSEIIHIGGDECPRENWKRCPRCQARMRELGLENEDELQSWCTRLMADYLAKKGRKAIGWNEIVAGGLASNVIVMCWNENARDAAKTAMRQGNPVVMTPNDKCYFDMSNQGVRNYVPRTERDLRRAYYFDPCEKLELSDRSLVWGGQCCTWTERAIDRKDVEWAVFPLFFATAEALWTGSERKPGLKDFKLRAAVHRERLVRAGVNAGSLPLK